MWFTLVFGVFVAIVIIVNLRQQRYRRRVLPSRTAGLDAFASSLGRDGTDPVVRALYDALCADLGSDGPRIRADDDLPELCGVVGEDLDDLVADTAQRSGRDLRASRELGPLVSCTPRRIVEYVSRLPSLRSPQVPRSPDAAHIRVSLG